jgi:hypothetical protein
LIAPEQGQTPCQKVAEWTVKWHDQQAHYCASHARQKVVDLMELLVR